MWLFATPWAAAHRASLSFTISQSLLTFMSIELVMLSNLSSSATPFSFCLQSLPTSGLFQRPFVSGGQSIGASASASVLPVDIQGWFPIGLIVLISLHTRDSQKSPLAPQFRSINSSVLSLLYGPALTSVHDYWKTIALTIWIFVGKYYLCFLLHCLGLS